ncbi:MAG: hypothetical protein MJY84_03175 [Bacteroidales bacterium]|nr:hypothetical protein [Bacteroidales bacterium]
MNRFSLFILGCLAVSIFTISCSSNSSEEVNTDPFESLESELEAYSASFVTQETKGPFWKTLGNVVMADALGAAVGSAMGPGAGVYLGAVSSFTCLAVNVIIDAIESNSTNLQDYYQSGTYLNEDSPSADKYDSIGIVHNRIITKLLDNNNIQSITEAEIETLVSNAVKDEGYDVPVVKGKDIDFVKSLSKMSSSEEMITAVEDSYPIMKEELKIVKIYTGTIANLDEENLEDYSAGFKDIVDKSSIDSNSKKTVKSAVSVAGNSNVLWNKELLN